MELRFTFNKDEKNYERIRPVYPKELFDDIIDYSKINETSHALEIGIGTGQATPPILNTGSRVTAIELGDNLSKFVKEKFKNYEKFKVINDDFIKCDVSNNYYDLVYCATAFHWLPKEEGYTKVRNILCEGGTIALFWNHPFPNRKDDVTNVVNRKVYNKYRTLPEGKVIKEFSSEDCNKIISELEYYGFRNIKSKLYHRVRTLSTKDYISLLNTYSDHIALPQDIKSAFEEEMERSLNEVGGCINIYDTVDLYLAQK